MDHNAVTAACSTCHNGTTATGKPATHIQTSAPCDDCHSTLAWIPASFDHAGAAGSCSSCHNGTTATGKSPTHFVTSVQCDECHSTSAWVPATDYSHSSPDYPGDHNASVSCSNCHQSNTQTATWTSAAYRPDCAGCHAGDYKSGPHDKIKDASNYTVSELRNCAGSCHVYKDAAMTTIEKTRNSRHRPNDGGF
jgi:hypothetical protein